MNKILKYGGVLLGIALLFAFIFPETLMPAGVTGAFALVIFTQQCSKNVSGASRIFIAEKTVAGTITVTGHEVSAISAATSFMRVDVIQDSVSWEEKGEQVGLNNWKISNSVKFSVMPPATATSTFLQALLDASPCGLLAIIIDGNGKCWLVGHNEIDVLQRPLRVKAQTQSTGAGLSDANGNTIPVELGNECSGKALPFDSTNTGTILASTAAFLKLT